MLHHVHASLYIYAHAVLSCRRTLPAIPVMLRDAYNIAQQAQGASFNAKAHHARHSLPMKIHTSSRSRLASNNSCVRRSPPAVHLIANTCLG